MYTPEQRCIMLERIWIHIQTYTIIALVNSPALFMMWIGSQPVELIHHGPQSTATQEAPIVIYSVNIEPEETSSEEQPQKEELPQKEEPSVSKKPSVKSKKETKSKKIQQKKANIKKTPVLDTKLSKNILVPKTSIQKKKRVQRKKARRRTARCKPSPNRRIQKTSDRQFVVKKKALNRYLGNIDNIRGLAKAYWYSGKRGEGILLKSIPCKSPLRNMGLLPNDIVVSINGKNVKNNLSLVGHYFNLRSKKNVDIILKRQNRPITLQYEIVKKLKKG